MFPYLIFNHSICSGDTVANIILQWRHNELTGVSNRRSLECLLIRLLKGSLIKISKLCVTGLCEGNSPVTGEFPAQRASNMGNVSIWWRHHDLRLEETCMASSSNCWCSNGLLLCSHYGPLGLYSLSDKMSYRQISRSLEAATSDAIIMVLL